MYIMFSLSYVLFLQQQYSPMVMRKFRRSLDNGGSEQPPNSSSNNNNMGSEESLLQVRKSRNRIWV